MVGRTTRATCRRPEKGAGIEHPGKKKRRNVGHQTQSSAIGVAAIGRAAPVEIIASRPGLSCQGLFPQQPRQPKPCGGRQMRHSGRADCARMRVALR